MYTSDIENNKYSSLRTTLTYTIISIFCALLGAIYELFSHEVYSYYMIYAFAIPLILGMLPYLFVSMSNKKIYPSYIVRNLHHSGVATLTVGSIIKGVLDIYGTTNSLCIYYLFIGALLLIISLVLFICNIKSANDSPK